MRTFTTRLLHVFLAVVLCVSMAPHVAFADTTPSTGTTTQETPQGPNNDKQPTPANSLQGKTSAPEAVNSTSAQASTPSAPAAQQGANAVPASKNDSASTAAATPDGNASSNYSEALPSNPANQGAQNQDEHGNSVNSPSNSSAASSAATQNQQAQAQNSTAVRASSDEGDGSDNPTSDGDGQDDYGVKPDDVCPNNEPDPYLPGSEPKFYSAADLPDGTYSVTANISMLTPVGARGYTTSPVNPVGIGPRGIPTAPLTYNATLKVNQGVYELSTDLHNPAFTVQEVTNSTSVEIKSLHTTPIPQSPAGSGNDMGHNENLAKPGSPKTRIDHMDLVLKNHSGLYQFGNGRAGWRVFATPLDMWIPNCGGEPSHSLDITVDLKNARLLANASGTKVFADDANKTRVELSFTTQSTHIADINAGKLLVRMTPLTNDQDIQYWVNSLHSYYSDIKADAGVRLYSLDVRNNNEKISFDLGMSAKVKLPLIHADDKVVFLDSQGAHELSGQRETVDSTSFITVTVNDTGIFYIVPKQEASKQLYTLSSPLDNDTHVRTVLSYGDPVRPADVNDFDYLGFKALVNSAFDVVRDFAKILVKATPLNNVNDFGVNDALRATSYGVASYGKPPAAVPTLVFRGDLSGSGAEMFLDLTYTLPTSTGAAQVFAVLSDTSGKQYGKCKLNSLCYGNNVSVSLNENQASIDALLNGIISDEDATKWGKAAFDMLVLYGAVYDSAPSDFEGLEPLHSKDGKTLFASLVVVDTGKKIKQPKPQANLLYSGQNQTVLSSTDEFDVEGASATEPGVYEAVVTPKRGFVWEDGTTTPYKFTWQIMNSDTSGYGVPLPSVPGGQGGDHNQGTQPENPSTPSGDEQPAGDGSIKPGTYTVSANIWFDKHDTGLPLNPHITNPGFPPMNPVANNARLVVNDAGEGWVTIPIAIQSRIMNIQSISGLNITQSDYSDGGLRSITVYLGVLSGNRAAIVKHCSATVRIGDLAMTIAGAIFKGERMHTWPATFSLNFSGLPRSGGGRVPDVVKNYMAGAHDNTVANAEEVALDALGDSSVTPQNDADTSTRAQAKSKGIAPDQSTAMNASTVAGIVVVVLALAALCAYAIVRSRKLRQQFTKFDDSERGPSQH